LNVQSIVYRLPCKRRLDWNDFFFISSAGSTTNVNKKETEDRNVKKGIGRWVSDWLRLMIRDGRWEYEREIVRGAINNEIWRWITWLFVCSFEWVSEVNKSKKVFLLFQHADGQWFSLCWVHSVHKRSVNLVS